MRRYGRTAAVVLELWALGASGASAQVIGAFRWQLVPYCNVVTLRVEQKGAVYELVGTDDQCGGTKLAPAHGAAHINPDGSIAVAADVTRLDGLRVATNATIALGTFSGSWVDDAGNSGAFTFDPPPAAGQPRPLRYSGTCAVGSVATVPQHLATHGVAFPRMLSTAPIAVDANIIGLGQSPTAACPGSAANPIAAPGHLCLYEQSANNLFAVCASRVEPDVALRIR